MRKIFVYLMLAAFLTSTAYAEVSVNGNGGIFVNGVQQGDKNIAGDLTVSGSIDWSGGNVIYVPLADNIETAIATATAGDTLVLAAGTYTVTDDIDVGVGVNIVGQGVGKTTVTCATASKKVFDISVSNVRIANLSISNTGVGGSNIYVKKNLTSIELESLNLSGSSTANVTPLYSYGSDVNLRDSVISGVSSDDKGYGIKFYNDSTVTQDAVFNIYNCNITADGTGDDSYAVNLSNSNGANSITVNMYNSTATALAGNTGDAALRVESATTNNAIANVYGCTLNGQDYEVLQTGSNVVTLYDTTLVNGTTSGTITYGGTVVSSDVYVDDDLNVGDDATIGGKITVDEEVQGATISVAKQHEEIGILLDNLTAPKAIVGFTGTGADTATENGYESGAGRVWTYSGGATTDKIFKGSTYVYSFDGTDSYMSTPDTADMSFDDSGANPFSIGGWVEVVASADSQSILSRWDTTTGSELREYLFQLSSSEKLQIYLYDESADKFCSSVTDAALLVGWHYITMTYDSTGGATAANGITFYVDGVTVASTPSNDGDYVAMENLAIDPTISGYLGTGGTIDKVFIGDMGRLFVTAEELSAATVWKLYEKTRGYYNV